MIKIQYISRLDNSGMLSGFAEVFRVAGYDFRFSHIDQKDILHTYNHHNPDIVLVHHNRGILDQHTWNQMNCFKIWWSNDDRFPPDNWRVVFAPIFDLFLVASLHSVEAMRQLGTKSEYLIMGYREKGYENQERTVNMAFLGQNSGEDFTHSKLRGDFCKQLQKDLGKNFALHGAGWGDNIERTAQNIYHRTKIGLSISHEYYKHVYSNRLLQIMGHGAMCLCYRTSDLEDIFKEDETCVYFSTYEELLEKYHYYIKNEEKRAEIALKGRQFVENNFQWKHKAKPIIEFIKKYYDND